MKRDILILILAALAAAMTTLTIYACAEEKWPQLRTHYVVRWNEEFKDVTETVIAPPTGMFIMENRMVPYTTHNEPCTSIEACRAKKSFFSEEQQRVLDVRIIKITEIEIQ